MARRDLVVGLEIDGLRETLAAFRRLPKDASAELRDAAQKIAEVIATAAKGAAVVDVSPQARLMAPTITTRRDRVPVVQAGGSRKVGRAGAPAYKLLFGSEFGSNRYRQFHRPHQGRKGAWFFATVEKNQGKIEREWLAAADEIIERFTAGD